MKVVISDDDRCSGCMTCDKELPGFKKNQCGMLMLKSTPTKESIDFAIERAIKFCPRNAIYITGIL